MLNFRELQTGRGVEFEAQTGITLEIGAGVDCSIYKRDWLDVAPAVEIICADFTTAKQIKGAAAPVLPPLKPTQLDLLAAE